MAGFRLHSLVKPAQTPEFVVHAPKGVSVQRVERFGHHSIDHSLSVASGASLLTEPLPEWLCRLVRLPRRRLFTKIAQFLVETDAVVSFREGAAVGRDT